MGLNFNEISTELESIACFENAHWLTDENSGGVPWRNQGALESTQTAGSRQHVFRNIWEQSLDPQGTKETKGKSVNPDEVSIDWKKWPPNIPLMPKGVKIPIKEAPQIDLKLSLSGQWEEIVHGTTIVPINYADKKFFDNLGGYLNIAKSLSFSVHPPSLLFLNTRAGQYYSVKLRVLNNGVISRKLRIIPPANLSFTIIRPTDPRSGVAPGNTLTLTVKYLPKSNESVTDVIVFHVEGDGALTVSLVSSCVPDPILEVEEWNCGCCVVGVPRTVFFEVKNIGGEGRFWILTEDEFNNESLECHVKYKRNLIKDSTREMVRTHARQLALNSEKEPKPKKFEKGKSLMGIGEASGIIKRQKDSMDTNSASEHPRRRSRKVKPMIYTRCFRIQPSCFRLQRNQKIDIKVRYLPKDANFHYEKLAIMCENGEVRWIAVKGLGIERDSEKLVELRAHWTGPPVDLPSDPRTKYIMDCGDLISGELGVISFTIKNRSCIPLYFFWSIRPVLTDPNANPEHAETSIMERFFETTLEDKEGNAFFTGEARTDKDHESWVSLLPLSITPAQGLMEKKEEVTVTFTAQCPSLIGYHACILSLYVEQVDEESKQTVITTIQGLEEDKLTVPISRALLHQQLETTSPNTGSGSEEPQTGGTCLTPPVVEDALPKIEKEDSIINIFSSDEPEQDDENEGYVTMKESLEKLRTSLKSRGSGEGSKGEGEIPEEAILPIVVAQRLSSAGRGSQDKSSRNSGSAKDERLESPTPIDETAPATPTEVIPEGELSESSGAEDVALTTPPPSPAPPPPSVAEEEMQEEKELTGKVSATESEKSKNTTRHSFGRRESINLRFIPPEENTDLSHDREMNQGHGVYEDLNLYTESVIPAFNLWPNREEVLTPVAEVEIWLHSVPLDVTFYPPFVIANGYVRSQAQRLIKVRNGTGHVMDVSFQNIVSLPIPVTCHPSKFSVKPNETFTFKLVIYFEKYGQVQQVIKGMLSLPFMSIPCSISTYLRCMGPFLEVLTPTLNFGIVPLNSETMKTIALRNSGIRPIKWLARIAPENLEDEGKHEISSNQTRTRDKRLIRVWPEWGLLEPGESRGVHVYFCAELGGELVISVEVMVDGNPESIVAVPVYGTVELPSLVLENGRIKFESEIFKQHPIQNATCTLINPTGFNVPFIWECPVGQSKLCKVRIFPNHGTIPAKAKIYCTVTVESLLGPEDPLVTDNLFVPCCVEGMREPLILKIECKPPFPGGN